MDGGAILTELESILAEQLRAAESLLEILGTETAALGRRDSASLAAATESKTALLVALDGLERRRRELARRIGAGPGQPEMDAWLAAYAAGSPREAQGIRQRWQALVDVLRRCRSANQANGLVVASLQRRVQQAIGLLRNGAAEPALYGPTGTAPAATAARALARA